MSHSNRKSRKEIRAQQKSSRKASNRTLYESWRDAGTNSKRSDREDRKARHGIRMNRHRIRAKVLVSLPDGRTLTQKQSRNTCSLKVLLRNFR